MYTHEFLEIKKINTHEFSGLGLINFIQEKYGYERIEHTKNPGRFCTIAARAQFTEGFN